MGEAQDLAVTIPGSDGQGKGQRAALAARLAISIPSVLFVCAVIWITAAFRDPSLLLITAIAVAPFALYLVLIRGLSLSLLAGGAMLAVTLWLYIASARDTSSTSTLGWASAIILDYFILACALVLQTRRDRVGESS
jgi:hypothetical protein